MTTGYFKENGTYYPMISNLETEESIIYLEYPKKSAIAATKYAIFLLEKSK